MKYIQLHRFYCISKLSSKYLRRKRTFFLLICLHFFSGLLMGRKTAPRCDWSKDE